MLLKIKIWKFVKIFSIKKKIFLSKLSISGFSSFKNLYIYTCKTCKKNTCIKPLAGRGGGDQGLSVRVR